MRVYAFIIGLKTLQVTRISFFFKKELSYKKLRRKKTNKTVENNSTIDRSFQRMNSVFMGRQNPIFGNRSNFKTPAPILGFQGPQTNRVNGHTSLKYVNQEMKKNLLNRRKSRLLLNQNLGIYSTGISNPEFTTNQELGMKKETLFISKDNSQRESVKSQNLSKQSSNEMVEAKDKSLNTTLNISKIDGSLQYGLYTIVEEDKSILNKSRVSLSTKKEQKLSNGKIKQRVISLLGGDAVFNDSEVDSNGFQTSSLLKNINIMNDFMPVKIKPNPDYIESSIYDPFSSEEEEEENNRKTALKIKSNSIGEK